MRRNLIIVCFVLSVLTLPAKVVYLDTGGSELWNQGNAVFFVHSWGSADDDQRMQPVEGDIYQATIPDRNNNLLFVRMPAGSTAIDWSTYWNQTYDLQWDGQNNLYTITDWATGKYTYGSWSVYGSTQGEGQGGNQGGGQGGTDPSTDYASAVPDASEDIMLQAFYWGSYQNAGFGDTRWTTLSGQVSEWANYFSLLWLPPSSASKGDMGYIPSCYSSQSSTSWGKTAALQSLLNTCHSHGMRVIADIVINHSGNAGTSCDFNALNFGSYGSFTPTSQWITANDEGKSKYGCNVGSNADDGQNGADANYAAARDWDHKNPQVQAMCRAYLQWLKHNIGYDGFRFDYVGGYHVAHIQDYLSASKPYFSVIEYWIGDASVLRQRIEDSGRSTLAFDFANHYTAFRDGIGSDNYSKLLNAGMRGQGMSKYAVTFIDNHDTYNRGDINQLDFLKKNDGSSIGNAAKVLQANAYLLAMPGVPCVFYPHWIRYKTDIQKMITARRYAGIHSESTLTEKAGNGYYEATVQGKRGQIVLYLGSSASKPAPDGFNLAVKGSNYAMYYTGHLTAVEETQTSPTLDPDAPIYNILGQPVTPDYKGLKLQNGHKYL